MSGVRERPILFAGEMVRAILDDRKTQTRRVVKLPHINRLGVWEPSTCGGTDSRGVKHPEHAVIWHTRTGDTLSCPYGQPGDRLWVRETWQYYNWDQDGAPEIRYQADNATAWPEVPESNVEAVTQVWADLSVDENYSIDGAARDRRWRPSIHMPRWACRLVLEVTDVRVERLRDISRGDAMDEGCPFPNMAQGDDPRQWYANLWGQINGAGSWESNPWVWAITFNRKRDAATGEMR